MPLFSLLQLSKLSDLARQNRIAPVYLFIGPSEIALDKAKEIYSLLLERGASLEIYDLRDREQRRAFLQLRGFQEGLFGIRKIYLVMGGEEIPEVKREEIVNFLKEGKNLFTWFILAEKMGEDNILYQYALEKGAIIPLSSKRREDLLESELWMTLKDFNLFMDKKTASLFLNLVGEDYHHFKRELEKLLLYCRDEGKISEEKILEIVVPSEDKELFLLGDMLFKQNPHRVIKFVSNLLDNKREPGEILTYLFRYFKRLRIFKDFLQDNPELEKKESYSAFDKAWQALKEDPLKNIPKILLDTHPYVLYNAKQHLRKISNFDRLFELLFKAEIELKMEYKTPLKVFSNFLFDFWRSLQEDSTLKHF
ncbi:MAG: hypothetical protein N2327_08225 [Caldimicrobium sp.]|nr:hypothetical protein [Caldimicrobium sp.]MCX7874394.1 hypothetical protein [Caldimicrobium sp.]MDW8094020.1 hypothetical protein [Caldimicrobium sp.]